MPELNRDWDELPEPEFDLTIANHRWKNEKVERAAIIGQILSKITSTRCPLEELRVIKAFLELRERMIAG